MKTHEFDKEFAAITQFVKDKYGIEIQANKELNDFTQKSLLFMMTIRIWQKHLSHIFKSVPMIEMYFQEMLSNAVHIILLANIEMKIPTLIMMRRTQELILKYLYYSEHLIEFYKKEMDESSKTVNGFPELKEYIKSYPFSLKYNVDNKKMQELVTSIINDWTKQYKDLSNYVHGSNSNFFQGAQYIDDFKFEKDDFDFLTKQIEILLSIVNTLLIIFYFENYIHFDENTEKSLIRDAISAVNKRKVVEILNEI